LRLGTANDELWSQLPPHLTTLQMRLSSDTTTEHLAHLPASLTHLALVGDDRVHRCFHADAAETVRLPSGLRSLRLQSVPYRAFRDLPSSLEHLIVPAVNYPFDCCGFDGPICHASLQTLELPWDFNFPITANHLPSLRELCLSGDFDQSFDDLPASLRKLTLKKDFEVKQPLDSLPADLTELDLARVFFNHPMARLPHGLLSLALSYDFNHPLDALPSGLTRLVLSEAFEFNRPLPPLPDSLAVLHLGHGFSKPLQQLPSSLRDLQFRPDSRFNHPLPPLPDSLSVLRLGDGFNQPLQRLPRYLTDLKLGKSFNHPLPLVKPEPALGLFDENRKQGSPSSYSTHSVADVDNQESRTMTYPVALRSLTLGDCFNQPLSLPPSLTSLSFLPHSVFRQPLPVSSLPVTLTYLRLPIDYISMDIDALRERCPFIHISSRCF